MIITFFINTLSSGGAEHQLTTLANLLAEKGYSVEIATYGDAEDHYIINPEIKRIKIGEGRGNYGKLLLIYKFFLLHKSDIYISFCQQNNLLAGLSLILGLRKTRLIVSERNLTIDKSSFIEKILFNIVYRRSNAIVPNSISQSNYINKVAPWLSNKIHTILNYTDIDAFKPIKRNYTSDIIQICVFARYDAQKNYHRFAEAVSELKQIGLKFHVDWYGSKFNGDNLRNGYVDFSQIVTNLAISDFVSLHDSIKDVAKVIPQYDFFCLPSLYEGFSNAIAEAICSGIPAVVSNVSDNPVMVKEGINGFLFNPTDTHDMVNCLKKMLTLGRINREEMGLKSRMIAENLFDKNKFVQSYIDLL